MPKKKDKKERRKKPMEAHTSKAYHAGASAEREAFDDLFDRAKENGFSYISIRKLKRFKRGRVRRFRAILGGL